MAMIPTACSIFLRGVQLNLCYRLAFGLEPIHDQSTKYDNIPFTATPIEGKHESKHRFNWSGSNGTKPGS